ncbi:hypothetical protein DEU56DRAFT_836768 [Suillus clintonianus]|uniref:uncharacterized protein n=1 Tax=Suillus clintonianus TaxID=1904413 RepID=UPI001B864EFC|nr:uncharacterized protein DEU56DRAFT_836768 [Suillus clintonianus]KAG2119342.1 hypothetical protein DEU56DRAFT_836768 [Suillus clintonianus]
MSSELFLKLSLGLASIPHPSPSSASFLSDSAHSRIQLALDHAWADSTLSKYRAVVTNFLSFCDSEHIPPAARCPASDLLLCAFAASRVGGVVTRGCRSGHRIRMGSVLMCSRTSIDG